MIHFERKNSEEEKTVANKIVIGKKGDSALWKENVAYHEGEIIIKSLGTLINSHLYDTSYS